MLFTFQPETWDAWRINCLRPRLILFLLILVAVHPDHSNQPYPSASNSLPPSSDPSPLRLPQQDGTTSRLPQLRHHTPPSLIASSDTSIPALPVTHPHGASGGPLPSTVAANKPVVYPGGSSSQAGNLPTLLSDLHTTAPPSATAPSPDADRRSPAGDGWRPPCPGAYLDHRNNVHCPNLPRQPRSIKQRLVEVAHGTLSGLRWSPWSRQIHSVWSYLAQGANRSASASDCSPLLSPLWHLLCLLVSLFAAQLAALVLEDTLLRQSSANPTVASFTPSKSWKKRWSRAKWRLYQHWRHPAYAQVATAWLSLAAAVCYIGHLAFSKDWAPGRAWEDLPLRCQQTAIASYRPRAVSWTDGLFAYPPFSKPGRALVLSECIATAGLLLQPLQHLVPSGLLSPNVRVSGRYLDWALPSERVSSHAAPRAAVVETKWLIGIGVEVLGCLAAVVSYLTIAVHVPRPSYVSVPVFLALASVRSLCQRLAAIKRAAARTLSCLHAVLSEFATADPPPADWVCSICFEQAETAEDEEQQPAGCAGTCTLHCGHSYHARCLARWLHQAEFCPVCHRHVAERRKTTGLANARAFGQGRAATRGPLTPRRSLSPSHG